MKSFRLAPVSTYDYIEVSAGLGTAAVLFLLFHFVDIPEPILRYSFALLILAGVITTTWRLSSRPIRRRLGWKRHTLITLVYYLVGLGAVARAFNWDKAIPWLPAVSFIAALISLIGFMVLIKKRPL